MEDLTTRDFNADLKSDRLNDDVVLFMGCTLQELLAIIGMSVVLGMSFALVLMKLLTGSLIWGLPVGIVFFFITFFVLVIRFSLIKRDKPAGYYQQYLRIKASQFGIYQSPFLMRSGKWSTDRRV